MDMRFLYLLSYDYGSTHIHPMFQDGESDFNNLISQQNKQLSDDVVLRNSIIVQSMLTQDGMNGTTVGWRAIVYDFLEQIRRSLEDGSIDYADTLYKMIKAYPDFNLCEKRS